jgi:hypothetical protein
LSWHGKPEVIIGPDQYFNPLAFIQPLPGTFGNEGRNILEGASLKQFDLALAKRWSLSERLRLQFRSEFFNLFNHTNLNTPNPWSTPQQQGDRHPQRVLPLSPSTLSSCPSMSQRASFGPSLSR